MVRQELEKSWMLTLQGTASQQRHTVLKLRQAKRLRGGEAGTRERAGVLRSGENKNLLLGDLRTRGRTAGAKLKSNKTHSALDNQFTTAGNGRCNRKKPGERPAAILGQNTAKSKC